MATKFENSVKVDVTCTTCHTMVGQVLLEISASKSDNAEKLWNNFRYEIANCEKHICAACKLVVSTAHSQAYSALRKAAMEQDESNDNNDNRVLWSQRASEFENEIEEEQIAWYKEHPNTPYVPRSFNVFASIND